MVVLQEAAVRGRSAPRVEDGAADERTEGEEMHHQQPADHDDRGWCRRRGRHRVHTPSLQSCVSIPRILNRLHNSISS